MNIPAKVLNNELETKKVGGGGSMVPAGGDSFHGHSIRVFNNEIIEMQER